MCHFSVATALVGACRTCRGAPPKAPGAAEPPWGPEPSRGQGILEVGTPAGRGTWLFRDSRIMVQAGRALGPRKALDGCAGPSCLQGADAPGE